MAFDILAGINHVQQQGEMGRARGTQTFTNKLLGEAYNSQGAERQSALSKLGVTQPGMAMAAEGQFEARDAGRADQRTKRLVEQAKILMATPEAMRGGVYAQMLPQLREMGIQAPDTPDATVWDMAGKLAAMGEAGERNTVRSSFVGADGQMYSILSDGSVKAQGIGADRKLQAFDVPGVGPQVVDLRNATARTVTAGGGAPQMGAPQQSPAQQSGPVTQTPMLAQVSSQFPGFRPTSTLRTPERNAEVGGVSNSFHLSGDAIDGYPASPQQRQEIGAWAAQNGMEVIDYPGGRIHIEPAPGGSKPTMTPTTNRPPTLDRRPLSEIGGGEDRPAWVRPASGGQDGAPKPPSGYRYAADGVTLQAIPGGPADKKPQDKPLPVGALKLQLDAKEAMSVAEGVDDLLAGFEAQIEAGTLDLGPVKNALYEARNLANQSTPESQAYASFKSGLEKLRNDSLRLNAGVQTDGDAQRAWNELMANINDRGVVKARLKEIREINARGLKLQREKLRTIDRNYSGKSAAPEDDISDLMQLYGDEV